MGEAMQVETLIIMQVLIMLMAMVVIWLMGFD